MDQAIKDCKEFHGCCEIKLHSCWANYTRFCPQLNAAHDTCLALDSKGNKPIDDNYKKDEA